MNEGVHVLGHEAFKVSARLPSITRFLFPHAHDDAPSSRRAVASTVRIRGAAGDELVKDGPGGLKVDGAHRPHEVRWDKRRAVVESRFDVSFVVQQAVPLGVLPVGVEIIGKLEGQKRDERCYQEKQPPAADAKRQPSGSTRQVEPYHKRTQQTHR